MSSPNVTIGGSSEKRERFWNAMKPLDEVISKVDASPETILKVLAGIADELKVLELPDDFTCNDLMEIYEEETTTCGMDNVIEIGMEWITHKLKGTNGRKACRSALAAFFDKGAVKEESSALKVEDSFMEVEEKKHDSASRCAEQIMRSCMKFNGINADEYIKWRYTVATVIESAFVSAESWTRYYCILFGMEANLLLWAKSIPIANSAKESVSGLWNSLDTRFLTSQTVNSFERDFAALKQAPSEAVETFASRFLKFVEMRKGVFGMKLTDLELRAKFANALTNPALTWIKAVAEGTAIDFESYMRTIISFDKNIPRQFVPTAQLMAMGGLRTSKCYRCDKPGHFADKCTSEIVANLTKRCQKCGTTRHGTSSCKVPDLKCLRCRRPGHVAGVCRGTIQNAAADLLIEDHHGEAENNSIMISASRMEFDNLYDGIIDTKPWTKSIKVINKNKSLKIPDCLLDSGASASFLHRDVENFLSDNGLIIEQFSIDLTVSYANGATEKISRAIKVKAMIGEESSSHDITFLVTRQCSPRVILGRTILKALQTPMIECGAVSISPSLPVISSALTSHEKPIVPWIEDKQDHLVARLPMVECANVLPYKEKDRRMSSIDSEICFRRLMKMSEQGKVAVVPAEECHVTLATRLVDKQQGTPRTLDDPNLHSRYRITLDCRPINEMRLLVDEGRASFMLVPPGQTEKTPAKQSQFGSRELLQTFPVGGTNTLYAKLDLSDAYNSVRVAAALGRLFNASAVDPYGQNVYFRWLCLPQGWKHSPFLFSLAVNSILKQCDEVLSSLGVTSRHYQDDILLAGDCEDKLKQAMEFLMDKFGQYDFQIRKEKCVGPASTLIYCGFQLQSGCLVPAPKTAIERQLIDYELKKFLHGNFEEQTTWIRHWSGRFQYFRDFIISPDVAIALDSFYKFLKMSKTSVDESLHDEIQENFVKLANATLNPLPLTFGYGRTLKCVLIVDANCESWGGILFRCVSRPDHSDQNFDSRMADLEKLMKTVGVKEPFKLLPVKMLGGVFSDRQRRHSSTHRERVAQLEAFDECVTLLNAPLIMVCDNKNCSLEWHNLDLFGSRHLDLWEKLQSALDEHGHQWLRRESAPAIADEIARIINVLPAVTLNAVRRITPANNGDGSMMGDVDHGHFRDHAAGFDIAGEFKRELIQAQISHHDLLTKFPNRYKIIDELLVYTSSTGPRLFVPNFTTNHLLTAPARCRVGLLQIYHDQLGHCGVSRLLTHIVRNWYWPTMAADCINYTASCEACRLAVRRPFPSGEGEMRSVTLGATTPFEHLMIDYATYQGQHLLLIIDCYSHWLFTSIVEDQTAVTTAKELRKLFLQIGFPSKIISDNGSHFVNELMTELSNMFGFRLWTGSSHHPQRQGLVERAVGEIKQTLKKFELDANEFNVKVGLATFTHNISCFRFAPNLSPYILLYGREPKWLNDPPEHANHVPTDQLREVWEYCRRSNFDAMNDVTKNQRRYPLKDGDRVIWTHAGNKYIKMIKEKQGNIYVLTDGRRVPENQLQLLESRFEHLDYDQSKLANAIPAKINDLILFLRDDCMDVGRVLGFDQAYIHVINLYMDENGSWFEHGPEYEDYIPFDSFIKVVRLNKINKLDKRYL